MAFKRLFPTADSTIQSLYPLKNEGMDEVLEVGSYHELASRNVFRTVIRFDIIQLTGAMNAANLKPKRYLSTTPSRFKTELILRSTEHIEIITPIVLRAYPLAASFTEGAGSRSDSPHTNTQVSWLNRNTVNAWVSGSGTLTSNDNVTLSYTSSYSGSVAVGASYIYSYTPPTGSNTPLSSEAIDVSQTLEWYVPEVSLDITKIASEIWARYDYNIWSTRATNTGTSTNFGVLVMADNSLAEHTGVLQFFSRQTHTVYPPSLDLKWNDYYYSASGVVPTSPDNILITDNLKKSYGPSDIITVIVTPKRRYPQRSFATASMYSPKTISLPSSSYWMVRDVATGEAIIPYDESYLRLRGRVDNDSDFVLDMDSFMKYRLYRVEYRIDWGDTVTTHQGSSFMVDKA